jgi:hypothetical protein
MKNEFRLRAHKEDPEVAKMTDFSIQHEKKLKQLHRKYVKETGQQIPYMPDFVFFMYQEGQDLVINPQLN